MSIGPRRERLGRISKKVLLGIKSSTSGVAMLRENHPPVPTSADHVVDQFTGVPAHSSGPPERFFGGTARSVTVTSACPASTHSLAMPSMRTRPSATKDWFSFRWKGQNELVQSSIRRWDASVTVKSTTSKSFSISLKAVFRTNTSGPVSSPSTSSATVSTTRSSTSSNNHVLVNTHVTEQVLRLHETLDDEASS